MPFDILKQNRLLDCENLKTLLRCCTGRNILVSKLYFKYAYTWDVVTSYLIRKGQKEASYPMECTSLA